MTYTSRIRLGKKKAIRSSKRSKRNYLHRKWKTKASKRKKSSGFKKNVLGAISTSFMTFSVAMVFIIAISFAYIQFVSVDLPSPEKPFGEKNFSSEMYDRNGQLMYRFFGDENRDPVKLDEVPALQKWALLAAEDIEYYEHSGVDVQGMTRCTIEAIQESRITCGASTITQQLIKQTALSNEVAFDRKLREIILAFQIERLYTKDQILEMYLTVIPEGSNVYSIESGANFYFGKNLDELNLAEMAVLAAIPQNPSQLSPTKSSDPTKAIQLLSDRKIYVLEQMEINIDYINAKIREEEGEGAIQLTSDMIAQARSTELAYENPDYQIVAPHFVFYAQELLTTNGIYKENGEPFTIEELQTGGYKIWTTLDQEFQTQAEIQVSKGVKEYGGRYGAENGAMIVMRPNSGEILAMVGSKDYFGTASPQGCKQGDTCRFEPNVNITNTLQSYGSSMKPMVYYLAIKSGLVSPGSVLADVPIQLGSYKPKNYEGNFAGLKSARWMLVNSRNIPAIYLVDNMGVKTFINEMKRWGYTTLDDPRGYGPSVAIGGADIKLVDHAQAYGVFANNGKLTQKEAILKIEDKDGNVIFQHVPQTSQVADARSVYLVNHMLNGRHGGPGYSFDGRDISGKTGTSESQRETLFATYTPEIVVIGWLGNNNNEGMRYGASGLTSARPWVTEYVEIMSHRIPATKFNFPGGITIRNGDIALNDIAAPGFVASRTTKTCNSQITNPYCNTNRSKSYAGL